MNRIVLALLPILFAGLLWPAAAFSTPGVSLSVGDATTGKLMGGRALPSKGPGFRLLSRTVKRGFYYGTARLVDSVQRAADRVRNRWPASTLGIGNLSRSEGGDIPQSRSHNSGRDVDLAFYVLDRRGKPARPDDLVRFPKKSGVDNGTWVFDVQRNWDLVAALLESEDIEVDWIFVANWLREPLLEYARRRVKDDALILRAETALKQPGDSAPHDDHFHLRVFCTDRERVEASCTNYGWVWPWAQVSTEWWRSKVQRRIEQAGDSRRPTLRRASAIEQLAEWRACEAISDAGEWLKVDALRPALVELAARCGSAPLASALSEAGALSVSNAIRLAHRTHAPELCPPLALALRGASAADKPPILEALGALGTACAAEAAADWISAAEHPTQTAARAVVLGFLGYVPPSSASAKSAVQHAAQVTESERLETALAGAGVKFRSSNLADRIETLIRSLDEAEPIGQNARRLLVAYTGAGAQQIGAPKPKAVAFWKAWWKGRKGILTAKAR